MFAPGCFDAKNTRFWWEIIAFFAASLTQMDLGDVDTKEAFVLVWLTMKYVIKSTDLLPTLRKVYFEIDIALWSSHNT